MALHRIIMYQVMMHCIAMYYDIPVRLIPHHILVVYQQRDISNDTDMARVVGTTILIKCITIDLCTSGDIDTRWKLVNIYHSILKTMDHLILVLM
jgi:hypothetical protein